MNVGYLALITTVMILCQCNRLIIKVDWSL